MNYKSILGLALIGGFVFLLYFPVFIWLIHAWQGNPSFNHGFFILPISAFLIWRRRKELTSGDSSPLGFLILVLGLMLYTWGFLKHFHFLTALSLLPVSWGLILYFGGKKAAWLSIFPIAFLIFMIPPPFLNELSSFLQSLTTLWSAEALKRLGISVSTTGAQIQLPNSNFFIGLPCSGINALISLLVITALFGYLLKGEVWRRIILFLLAFPIAIFANLARIISLLLIGYRWGTRIALIYFHSYFDLMFYFIALLSLGLIAWLLGCRLTNNVTAHTCYSEPKAKNL